MQSLISCGVSPIRASFYRYSVKLIVTFRVLLKKGCHQKASTLRTTGRIETVIVSTTRKLPPPTMDYTQDAKFIITVQC